MVEKIQVLTDRQIQVDKYGFVGNAKALLDLSSKMMTTEGIEAQLDVATQMVASATLLKEECTRALLAELSEFKMDENQREHLKNELVKIMMHEAKNTTADCDLEDTEKYFRKSSENLTINQLKANIIMEISTDAEVENWEDEAIEIVNGEPDSQSDYDNRVSEVLEEILLRKYDEH